MTRPSRAKDSINAASTAKARAPRRLNGVSHEASLPDDRLPSDVVLGDLISGLRSDLQRRFCVALARYGTVTHALIEAGMTFKEAYSWREQNPEFKKAWDNALVISTDIVELAARQRAIHGVSRFQVSAGKVVMHNDQPVMITEYSDRLLEVILKGRRRDVYGDQVTHRGDPTAPINIKVSDRDSAL